MSRSAVEQTVYLLDEAFEGKVHSLHSMLGNLVGVREQDWLWVPPDGTRSIRTLVAHVGGALWLYYDRAFGSCEIFGDPIVSWNAQIDELGVGTEELQGPAPIVNEPAMADVVSWATARFRAFRDAVSALDDESIMEERPTHWGEPRPIRWFVGVMIQHCSYHAGEINHIRALHQGND
jgi:hypothetical protein